MWNIIPRNLFQQGISFLGLVMAAQAQQRGWSEENTGDFMDSIDEVFMCHCLLRSHLLIAFPNQVIDMIPGIVVPGFVGNSFFVYYRVLLFISPFLRGIIFLLLFVFWDQMIHYRLPTDVMLKPNNFKRSRFAIGGCEFIVQTLPNRKQFRVIAWGSLDKRGTSCRHFQIVIREDFRLYKIFGAIWREAKVIYMRR